jgi:hypothetical protein
MWLSSILCWPKMTRKSGSRGRPERGPSRRPRRTCRPTLEALEDRAVPTIFNVPAGDVPGLTAALGTANKNGEPDTVNLAPGATYTLTAPSRPGGGYGLTVLADGGQLLTVNGNGATITRAAGSPDFGILEVSGAVVTLSGLTLTNGNNPTFEGGGIYNAGTLTLSNSTLSGNSAARGAGIYNVGTLTLIGSTLSGNMATNIGGGIGNNGQLTLSNSTLSGNSAGQDGGGIWNFDSFTATNATITANRADADFDNSGQGGGIDNIPGSTLRLRNTIVAGNFHGAASARDDIKGAAQASAFNLVGDGTGLTGMSDHDANGNLVGTALAPLDPRLGPLQDNGGPTMTHALLAGSPAIDRGLAPGLAPATDQRGAGRSGPADIGAFEFLPPPPVPPARAVVAALVSRKVGKRRLLFVRVSFADTGAVKAEVRSPFQRPAFRAIVVAAFDGDGDGVTDSVRLTARRGKKTLTRVFPL